MPSKQPKGRRTKDTVREAMRDASRLPGNSIADVEPEELSITPGDDEDLIEEPDETTADAYATASKKDSGELYGVHTPHAEDKDLGKARDQESFKDEDQGENWLETLEKKAAEGGAEPEEELDVIDESDPEGGHHSTESGDRPVADKGSGGPSGL
jgi:hypothetical protein